MDHDSSPQMVRGDIAQPGRWRPALPPGTAVVNAANMDVAGVGMGGVTQALFDAVGGEHAWQKLVAQGKLFRRGSFGPASLPLPTCTSVLRTGTAGSLAAAGIDHIFHVAGPDCAAGQSDSVLPSCYRTALEAAEATAGVTHLVFPLLSGGIYGCPTSLGDAAHLLSTWQGTVEPALIALAPEPCTIAIRRN